MPVLEQINSADTAIASLTHLPEGFANQPGLLFGLAAVGVGVSWQYLHDRQNNGHGRNTNALNSTVSSAGPAIEAVFQEAPIEPAQANRVNRSMRIRRAVATTGLVTLALAAGEPFYTTTSPVDTPTIIIRDGSYSMLKTTDGDGGKTRIDTALPAAGQAFASSSYPTTGNNVYVIDYANGTTVSPRLTTQSEIISALTAAPRVDPNGGDLTGAIKQAESMLDSATETKPAQATEGQKEGTVILMTDGTVDRKAAASGALADLEKKANLIVVQVGSDKASYTQFGTKYDSSADTRYLKGVGKSVVISSTDTSTVAKALEEKVTATGVNKERHPWKPGMVIPAALLAVSALSMRRIANQQLHLSRKATKQGRI